MKFTYSAILIALFGFCTASAQIADYSVSSDWTAVDLDGVTHNLYDMTDAGKTVIIDLSAAWCGPCWTIHQSGKLQDLHEMYGPDGTDEMRVFYIESESTNSLDQLMGIGTTGVSRATDTQGDWLEGQTYPFIDDASIAALYELGAYPTLSLIGPDRLTRTWVGSPGPTIDEVYEIVENASPIVDGTDARVILYDGPTLSLCGSVTPSVLIQNHGTSVLTELSFDVIGDGTVIYSYDWTGTLMPYETTSISMDEFDGSPYAEVSVECTTADDELANNMIMIEGLTVLGPNATNGVFNLEDTDPAPNSVALPDNLTQDPSSDWDALAISNADLNNVPQSVGAFENSEFSILFNFYQNREGASIVYLDKLDMTNWSAPIMVFNHAYKQYAAENDRLLIQASTNCGGTWTTIFDEQGAGLTTGATQSTFFVPVADDWQHNTIDMSAYADETELIIRYVGVSAFGNNLWVDDIRLEEFSSVAEIETVESASVFPNPANGVSTLEINLTSDEDLDIQIVDQLGRVSKNVFSGTLNAGQNAVELDVTNMAAGLYNVVVRKMEANQVNTIRLQVQ